MLQSFKISRRSSLLRLIIAVIILSAILAIWPTEEITICTPRPIHFPVINPFEDNHPDVLYTSQDNISHSFRFNDFTQLIDFYNFQFLINHNCNDSSSLSFVILVVSKPSHDQLRKLIRRTWGSFKDRRFKLFFLFGDPKNEEDQQILLRENQEFADVLQGNFIDSYDSLSYKHVMALKWALYFCPSAKYVVKCDDDAFLNTPQLINYISDVLELENPKNLMRCAEIREHDPVIRRFSKYKITYSEYPNDYWPPFCPGFFVMYSRDAIYNLYVHAQASCFIHLEDVFITAVTAQKANVTASLLEDKYVLQKKSDIAKLEKNYGPMTFIVGPMQLTEKEIELLWRIVRESKDEPT